jgi:hypothetical protein
VEEDVLLLLFAAGFEFEATLSGEKGIKILGKWLL